jgi:Ni,Fe-hydrogenase III large subunit
VLPAHEPTESWLRQAVGWADLEESRGRVDDLVAMVLRSRALRWRLAGRAIVTRAEALEQGLLGPVGRGSGLAADARTDDAAYRELGFEPVVRTEGDALARTLLRSEEALAAVSLAIDALTSAYVGADAPAGTAPAVEGPRGPITARRSAGAWERAARRAAAGAMVGLEWSAALVALASFDLSPWSAGE